MSVEAGAPGGPTIDEDCEVLIVFAYCEARAPLSAWGEIGEAVLARLRACHPSILNRFDIGFRYDHGVLDDHLAPVYTPRSAVDRLAELTDV